STGIGCGCQMCAKSFQIILVTSVLFAFSGESTSADDTSSFHLDRNHVAPATALEEAVTLLPKSSKSLVSDAETDMFKKFAARDFKSIGETDLILTVANIVDDKSRQRYRAKLDKITAEARKAVADAKTDKEKADLLVKFLFKNPLHGGYETRQDDMRV